MAIISTHRNRMRTFNLSKIGIKRWILKREDFIIMPAYQVVLIAPHLSDDDVITFQQALKIKHEILVFNTASEFTEYAFQPEHVKQPYVLYQVISDVTHPDLVPLAGTELQVGFYLYSRSLDFVHNPVALKEIVHQIQNLQRNFTSIDPLNLDEITASFKEEENYEVDHSQDQTQLDYPETDFIEPQFYLVTDHALTATEQQEVLQRLEDFGITDGVANVTNLQDINWENNQAPTGIINVSRKGYNVNVPACVSKLLFYVHVPSVQALTQQEDHNLQHIIGNYIDAFYAGDYELGKSQLQLYIDVTVLPLYQGDGSKLLSPIASQVPQQSMQQQAIVSSNDHAANHMPMQHDSASSAPSLATPTTPVQQPVVQETELAHNMLHTATSPTTTSSYQPNSFPVSSRLALALVGVTAEHFDPSVLEQLGNFVLGAERISYMAFFSSYDELYQASINNPELIVNVLNFIPLDPQILIAMRYGFFISLATPDQVSMDSNVFNTVNLFQSLVLSGYLGQVANLQQQD